MTTYSIQLQISRKWSEVIKVSSLEHLKFHTPAKRQYPWRIIHEQTGAVIDSYTPQKVVKEKAITQYKNSWAYEMALLKSRTT